jgi:putative holliday junction resolvase
VKLVAVDPGSVRVGVAVSVAGLAMPKPALPADTAALEIAAMASDEAAEAIVFGLPLTLAGEKGAAAAAALQLARETRKHSQLPIWLLDERLTTASASGKLREAGRSARQQRGVIDSQAACELLEFAMQLAARGANLGQNLEEL